MKNKRNYIDLFLKINTILAIAVLIAFVMTISLGVSLGLAAAIFAPMLIPLVSGVIGLSYVHSHKTRAAKLQMDHKLEQATFRMKQAVKESARLDENQFALNQKLNAQLSTTSALNARLEQSIEGEPKATTLKVLVGTFDGKKPNHVQRDQISADPDEAKIEIESAIDKLHEAQNLTDVLLDKRAVQINRLVKQ